MNRAGRQAGFTLLEILAALVVLAVLMLALRQGVAFGIGAWRTQDRLSAQHESLDAVALALRHLIEAMDPGTVQEPTHLIATAHELAFPTVLPRAGQAGEQVEAALLVVPGQGLVLRWSPRRHAVRLRPAAPPRQKRLLQDVKALDIGYWDGTHWLATWHGSHRPALVRLRLVFVPGEVRHWPDIVAAPRRDRPPE